MIQWLQEFNSIQSKIGGPHPLAFIEESFDLQFPLYIHPKSPSHKVLRGALFKVEKILKGSLDLISSPSPSVKIQIIGGKVCLKHKGKTLLADVNISTFCFKKFVDNAQQHLAFTPQANFPAYNLNFH